MSAEIRIIRRKGGIDQPRRAPKPQRDPSLDAMDALDLMLKEQGKRERFWKGEGEFEPVFLNTLDDIELIREMIDDPNLLFLTGQKTGPNRKGPWRPFYDEHGNRFIKVIPLMNPDHAHVNYKNVRWGDHRVNLTEGEQMEIKRRSNGSRLREEELAMDHRSHSRFGWHDVEFKTVPFDLPQLPENVEHWLDDTWRRYEKTKSQLIYQLYKVVQSHKADGDNRTREVKAQRLKEQELMTVGLWNTIWKWWMNASGKAKAAAQAKAEAAGTLEVDGVKVQFITTTEMPLTQAQLTSLKMIIETFRVEMGFEKPVMRFWTDTKCTKCDTERRMLLPLHTESAFCKTCGELTAIVLSYEWVRILDREETDWWEVADKVRRNIDHLYEIGADLQEIKRLERKLHWIEVEHIKFDDATMLFYGAYPDVDERYA